MPVDALVKEVQGMPEELLANVINFAKFLKSEAAGGAKKTRKPRTSKDEAASKPVRKTRRAKAEEPAVKKSSAAQKAPKEPAKRGRKPKAGEKTSEPAASDVATKKRGRARK